MVDLTLKLAVAPPDAGSIALCAESATPMIAAPPIVVPVQPLTDSRGRPLPLGAIQRLDNEELLKVLENSPGGPTARWGSTTQRSPTAQYFDFCNPFRGTLSPDGRFAMLGTDSDAGGFLWDIDRGTVRRLPARPLAASHDGKTVAMAESLAGERNIELYDVATGTVRRLPISRGRWGALTFSADDKRLFATWERFAENTDARFFPRYCYEYTEWDARTGLPVCHIRTPLSGKHALTHPDITRLSAVCEARKRLFFLDADRHFRAWDLVNNKQVRDWVLNEHLPSGDYDRKCEGGHVTPDGRLITVAAYENFLWATVLAVLDCDDGRCRRLPLPMPLYSAFRILGSSSDRSILAIHGGSIGYVLLDASTGELLLQYPSGENFGPWPVLSFAEGDRMLIVRKVKNMPNEFETTVWGLRRIRNAARQAKPK